MALSRTFRVSIMLFFSSALFFLELIVGYYANSIALIADSFHMLNDVLSLVIALYAIQLAKKDSVEPSNTYGWQRSEILGALMNAVLLIGLCLTIYIESIQRFFIIVEIEKPILVLLVGSVGLLFNIIGMYLFGEDHVGHSHSHDHSDHHESISKSSVEDPLVLKSKISSNTLNDGSDQTYGSISSAKAHLEQINANSDKKSISFVNLKSPDPSLQSNYLNQSTLRPDNDYPAVTQSAILESAEQMKRISFNIDNSDSKNPHVHSHDHSHSSGGNLNMRGVWLHVFGDCLANVAVISSALFIWLTDFSWKHYADPVISILINTLIVAFTIPLIKSTSFILLQGVPPAVDVVELYSKLRKIPNVFNVHELHVWQLSDSKIIASVHIQIAKSSISDSDDAKSPSSSAVNSTNCPGNVSGADIGELFMKIGKIANGIFHSYGVHSTTIQPEFISDSLGHILPPKKFSNGKEPELLDSENPRPESGSLMVYKNVINTDNNFISSQNTPASANYLDDSEPLLTVDDKALVINHSKDLCLLRCQDGDCADMECCPDPQPKTSNGHPDSKSNGSLV
ncbi:Zinc/cadmium resistance protein [Smittium mucronatum]|uniref:Zinc/cadmium resistance protein n=1 Tax=Smittium mucronatum TaxID=133383 RepID=A0A1R0GR16_9FUNG|nr:Zinc/cadmium resistance protein [Smittium mucronatum]